MPVLAHFTPLTRITVFFRRFSKRSPATSRSELDSDEPSQRKPHDQEKGTLKKTIKGCTQVGVFRLWAILCFIVPTTIVLVLFILLFIEIPRGKYISQLSPLTLDHHPITESKDPTPATDVSTWISTTSHMVAPRMCHSHNDYHREYPLFTALSAGCVSVEADVWLSNDGKDLLVGHNRQSLHSDKTLKSMYLSPIQEILEARNPNRESNSTEDYARSVFRSATRSDTTLVLLVDVKEKPEQIWPLVVQQLEPLRQRHSLARVESSVYNGQAVKSYDYGPLKIVGSGELTLEILRNTSHGDRDFEEYHDTFLDAPLQLLQEVKPLSKANQNLYKLNNGSVLLYNEENSHYSSVSFKKTIGSVMLGFSESQLRKLRTQIRNAEQSGLTSRYWDTPTWPINYRDYVWEVLAREGVGILNADDVHAAARGSWTKGYIKYVYLIIATTGYLVLVAIGIWILGLYGLKKGANGRV